MTLSTRWTSLDYGKRNYRMIYLILEMLCKVVYCTDSIALLNHIFLKTSMKLNIFENQDSLFKIYNLDSDLDLEWASTKSELKCSIGHRAGKLFILFISIGFMCILKKNPKRCVQPMRFTRPVSWKECKHFPPRFKKWSGVTSLFCDQLSLIGT